ncbi:hypothetical protein TB2_043809 [Malus domestica]
MKELHRALEIRGLMVCNLPEKGCSLFTTKDFSPGEVIICQERTRACRATLRRNLGVTLTSNRVISKNARLVKLYTIVAARAR